MTNRKSHVSFRLTPRSMTLDCQIISEFVGGGTPSLCGGTTFLSLPLPSHFLFLPHSQIANHPTNRTWLCSSYCRGQTHWWTPASQILGVPGVRTHIWLLRRWRLCKVLFSAPNKSGRQNRRVLSFCLNNVVNRSTVAWVLLAAAVLACDRATQQPICTRRYSQLHKMLGMNFRLQVKF